MPIPTAGGVYRMSPQQWIGDWYAYMENNPEGNVRGIQNIPGQQGDFVFTPVTHYGSGLFMISVKTWPDWFLYTESTNKLNVRACKGDPSFKGYYSIVPRSDNTILIKQVDDIYIYMQKNGTGNLGGWHGDPGPQGYWFIEAYQ